MKYSLVALTLVLVFAAPALSQNPPGGPPPIDRRTNAGRVRQQDMASREWQLRNFGNESKRPKDRRQLEALMAQTEEDFNRILSLHNELARAIKSNNAFNYQFVSEASAEIKKRASRVQSNLALELSAEEAAANPTNVKEFDEPHMKNALIELCTSIRSFVTNPSIENPNTIDAQHMARAKRDLENLIQLSGQIKKDADKIKARK